MADPAEMLGFGRTPPHDYELQPPRRWRAPWSRMAVAALTAVAAFTVGFIMTTGVTAGRESAAIQFARKDQLIELILERQSRADELSIEVEELRVEVEAAQAEAAAGVPLLRGQVSEAEMAAGLVPLQGPGVRLRLADSPTCPNDYKCIIQDADLQLAVNALFDAGAEAVAINDQRIMSTTAIRGVGFSVLANLTVLSGPYDVRAIGDPDTLAEKFRATAFWDEFMSFTQQYGLIMEIEEDDALVIPRFGGTVETTARPSDLSASVTP